MAVALIALVSATNIVSLALLCHFLLEGGQENGRVLIYSGALLYVTNVLLFGLWYWELDRGGPAARMRKHDRDQPDFLFPQMTDERWAPKGWLPGLGDYLYVSLTNATAFSPTDTMPLTQKAKALMGAQAMVCAGDDRAGGRAGREHPQLMRVRLRDGALPARGTALRSRAANPGAHPPPAPGTQAHASAASSTGS